jgi:anti-sigma B factor antagonist
MGGFDISVSYSGSEEDIAVISPKGYIDTTTVDQIENRITEVMAGNKFKIVVDLSDTEYVNSSGWGVFLRDLKKIRENNGDLVLARMSPDVHLVYDTMEFSQIFKSFDSVETALASFS